jgi:biopolymer transport protein ExbD
MKGGIIVRLIDVVFILLLGFISASDIIRKTQVKLPPQLVTSMGNQQVREPRPLIVRIMVKPTQEMTGELLQRIQGRLKSVGKKARVENEKLSQREVSEKFVTYVVRTGSSEDDPDEEMATLSALEKYILQQYQERLLPGQKLIVLILPHPEVIVQGIVNIFDICQRYKIEFHFKYPDAKKRLDEFL